MNKVICSICGTAYVESAEQCPICGYAQSSNNIPVNASSAEPKHVYVKGGHYSKSNTKKRSKVSHSSSDAPKKSKSKSNPGMIAVVILLLLVLLNVAQVRGEKKMNNKLNKGKRG